MAGHIFLLSCLLAVCLPIIFVQLPRFTPPKELHAEVGAETRSEVLRRRPSSSSRKTVRWSARSWSKTDADVTSAESEQDQVDTPQVGQTSARERWNKDNTGAAFGTDAWADRQASLDGGASEEEESRKARAGKKPWDPPFRRHLPRGELVGKSPGGQWHAVTGTSPRRKTGRELEERGVAMRLFPPDPVPEAGGVEDHNQRSQSSPSTAQPSQEHSQPKPSPGQLHNNRYGALPRSTHSVPSPTSQGQISVESIPSLLDGSAVPRSASSVTTNESPNSPCEYPNSSPLIPQYAVPVAVKEASKNSKKAGLPIWQILLLTMGSIVFVFAFAILVAHCLAWFIVYKTEARLGEVHSGLLRGGEMKLCLCGRG